MGWMTQSCINSCCTSSLKHHLLQEVFLAHVHLIHIYVPLWVLRLPSGAGPCPMELEKVAEVSPSTLPAQPLPPPGEAGGSSSQGRGQGLLVFPENTRVKSNGDCNVGNSA